MGTQAALPEAPRATATRRACGETHCVALLVVLQNAAQVLYPKSPLRPETQRTRDVVLLLAADVWVNVRSATRSAQQRGIEGRLQSTTGALGI